MNDKISILGAGSWGTALAMALSQKGYNVRLWGRNSFQIDEMNNTRENKRYLPGVLLPALVKVTGDIEEAVKETDIIVLSVSSQSFRSVLKDIRKYISESAILVNTAKGIEKESLLRLSQVAQEEVPENTYVVLSGPSHAEEVSRSMPTTLVASSEKRQAAEAVQDLFMYSNLRVYTNPDVTGVELGGALKNIIALGAGISDGLGFGDNSKAALMTRGMTEISRLGVKLGAKANTFSGLSGIGDLIVTCTSMHSRNRRCGMLIGKGKPAAQAIEEIGMVVEGIYATEAAYDLSAKCGVEMPITEQLYMLLHGRVNAKEAVLNLMNRQKKHEIEEIAQEDNIAW